MNTVRIANSSTSSNLYLLCYFFKFVILEFLARSIISKCFFKLSIGLFLVIPHCWQLNKSCCDMTTNSKLSK